MELNHQIERNKKPPRIPQRPKSQTGVIQFFKKIDITQKSKSALDNYQKINTTAIKPAKSLTHQLIIETGKKTTVNSPLNQEVSIPKRSYSNDQKLFSNNKSRNTSKKDMMQEVLADYDVGLYYITRGLEDDEEISQFFAQSQDDCGVDLNNSENRSTPMQVRRAEKATDSFEFVLQSSDFEEGKLSFLQKPAQISSPGRSKQQSVHRAYQYVQNDLHFQYTKNHILSDDNPYQAQEVQTCKKIFPHCSHYSNPQSPKSQSTRPMAANLPYASSSRKLQPITPLSIVTHNFGVSAKNMIRTPMQKGGQIHQKFKGIQSRKASASPILIVPSLIHQTYQEIKNRKKSPFVPINRQRVENLSQYSIKPLIRTIKIDPLLSYLPSISINIQKVDGLQQKSNKNNEQEKVFYSVETVANELELRHPKRNPTAAQIETFPTEELKKRDPPSNHMSTSSQEYISDEESDLNVAQRFEALPSIGVTTTIMYNDEDEISSAHSAVASEHYEFEV